MELTEKQFKRIRPYLGIERKSGELSHHQIMNAILYVTIHICEWGKLPERFGDKKKIYSRMRRWAKNGKLETVFYILQKEGVVRVFEDLQLQQRIFISKRMLADIAIPKKKVISKEEQARVIFLPSILKKIIQERNQS